MQEATLQEKRHRTRNTRVAQKVKKLALGHGAFYNEKTGKLVQKKK
jgi:hypothetical protein